MAAWREEDHPRNELGRFIPKGETSAVQRRRTVEHAESADESDLLDVFVRIAGKERLSRKDEADLLRLDAELKRREAGGEQQPTPEQRRVDELVSAGVSWDEAYREAYGRAGDDQDDDDRRPGESREQARRRQYAELTALRVLQAESATRGYLLNKAGQAAGIDPVSLFSGPEARARKYGSEELWRWWEANGGRQTYAEYRADRIGDTGGGRRARERRRTRGNGKDFG